MKIFGREPAMIVALIESAIAMAIAFGWLQFINLSTQEDLAIVMAVVSGGFGIYLAYVTNETLLGAVVGFLKALLALAAVYGLTISVEQTAALIAFVTMLIGFWQRTQVTPMEHPTFRRIAPDVTGPVDRQRAAA